MLNGGCDNAGVAVGYDVDDAHVFLVTVMDEEVNFRWNFMLGFCGVDLVKLASSM